MNYVFTFLLAFVSNELCFDLIPFSRGLSRFKYGLGHSVLIRFAKSSFEILYA